MTCVTNSTPEAHFKSLDRLQNYSVVNDSLLYALSYYQWIKSKNSVLENTLSIAEKTLKTIKDAAEPIAAQKLGFIDNAVNNQLERLEKTYPVILESSSTIREIPKKFYQDSVQTTKKIVMWPVTKTVDTVSKTSTMAMSAMSSVMETSIKRVLPSTSLSCNATNYILDKSEELLDKYLPDNDESVSESTSKSDIYSKIKRLSEKSQRRLYKKASNQINLLIKSSLEKLENIQTLIAEIQTKKESLKTLLINECSENFPSLTSKQSEFINETIQYSKQLKNVISTSASTTLEYVLSNFVHGLVKVNVNLVKLQDLLTESKPEFISDHILGHASFAISEIRKGLESFINMTKMLKTKFHHEETVEEKEMEDLNESDESIEDSDN